MAQKLSFKAVEKWREKWREAISKSRIG